MIAFRPRLGQIPELTGGITSGLARQIVAEAEPALRRVVHEERTRLAEALMGGLPFFSLASLAFIGTHYLVPDRAKAGKIAGYGAAAAAAGFGGWWTFRRLTGKPEEPAKAAPPAGPSALDPYVARAAQAIVQEAEPRVRRIVDEERSRLATAAQAGLPFWVGSLAAFLATFFLVGPGNTAMKAVGYSGSTVLFGAGTWLALEREKEAAAA
jgi:hypothetical protein